jgi:hypothetical protein
MPVFGAVAAPPRSPTAPAGLPGIHPPPSAASQVAGAPGSPATTSPFGTLPGGLDLSQILAGQTPPGTDPSLAALWSGIGTYELGPAAQSLGAQSSLLGAQGGLTQQQLSDQARLEQQSAGFSQQQLGVQGANLGLQRSALEQQAGPGGFQSQQSALTAQEQALQTAQQQRALRSGATSGGSINTAGTQQSWSDILAQQGFEKAQQALTTKEQQQQYATSKGQLDNAAKSLGISGQEVTARLNNALSQLGLQGRLDTLGITQAIQQLQSGFLSGPWATAIQQVLQAAGLPIQAFSNPALSGASAPSVSFG